MILVIDATGTDPDGNVLSGSVSVTVNVPEAGAPAEQAAVPQPPAPQLGDFQRRSIMMARQWGSR
jgi:hypothetical protein